MDTTKVSVACQTEPNLIDKLIDNQQVKKQLDDIDLYQEYVRSAQCAQFWPLDKNPIRSLVPSMVNVDLPEQYLKNESLMFDLVQAITNNSKLVNLLAKYIHHIVPNVIISKRIDLIPLITCTIRVCRDTNEQERLISLLFNLIKRPNEEQRRMILSGIVVVLQVSPHQSSSLLLPNLWDHVSDKFPERRILLAESCATLAHYVRPVMRTNLILSILIQLLRDKNAAVRSAACKSFACLLTLIMDRNDEVFDACLSATEDIIQDVMQQTPVNFCEHRYELEQMRFCTLETVYPMLCMWAVKLNRFKVEIAEFYLTKAEKYFSSLALHSTNCSVGSSCCSFSPETANSSSSSAKAASMAAVARRRSTFLESRNGTGSSASMNSSGFFSSRRQSSFVRSLSTASNSSTSSRATTASLSSSVTASPQSTDSSHNSAMLTSQRAVGAYLKMLSYLVPYVFSDAVNGCAWLSKSNMNIPSASSGLESCHQDYESDSSRSGEPSKLGVTLSDSGNESASAGDDAGGHSREAPADMASGNLNDQGESQPKLHSKGPGYSSTNDSMGNLDTFVQLFERPLKFTNRLLNPTMIIDQSAIVAFHDQLEQEHMIESLDWILNKFLIKFLSLISYLSQRRFYAAIGGPNSSDVVQEFLLSAISSTRQLCVLFGKHLTRSKIRPIIKDYIAANGSSPVLYTVYIASLTSFEPIEQWEFEEIVTQIRQSLTVVDLNRSDVETLALSIKIIATNTEQIQSPSMRQKYLTYILDALVSHTNQILRTSSVSSCQQSQQALGLNAKVKLAASRMKSTDRSSRSNSVSDQQQLQTKEFMLILFRHILTCLIDPEVRPTDWAHILVIKFLPLLIALANDSTDVYVCTYARLMCAQLVETFDTYLNNPKLTKKTADTMLPALGSLKALTEQIKASNLRRQIECLIQDLNVKFFNNDENNNSVSQTLGSDRLSSLIGESIAEENRVE